MAQSQPTVRPRQPLTVMSCLVSILVLVALIAGLSGFWLFFTRVVAPRLQRFIPNPEGYRGIGESLTYLELEPLTGSPSRLSLSDLRGHVVLLNFWGTWCRPCRDELPHMAELRKRFAGQEKFRLVAVSCPAAGQSNDMESLYEETAALLKRLGLDLPTYCDPDDITRQAVDQVIGFQGFPTTLLLDRYGVIRAIWVGYRPGVETEIERYVDKVLDETEGEKHRGDTEIKR